MINISTHAPLAGRDLHCLDTLPTGEVFQPTRPLRGATRKADAQGLRPRNFNPRAPCGARRSHISVPAGSLNFNPRAPCGARLVPLSYVSPVVRISTHAPLAGRDGLPRSLALCCCYFNPRAPCGARQRYQNEAERIKKNFNPRAPCGARRPLTRLYGVTEKISTHAPLAGRD